MFDVDVDVVDAVVDVVVDVHGVKGEAMLK